MRQKFGVSRKEGIVAVGDSLEHDIKGAMLFGIDSLFITRGIHARELHKNGGDFDAGAMEKLVESHALGAFPTIVAEHWAL